MSIAEVWPHLTQLREYPGLGRPMTWKVLYSNRKQPLLTPVALHQSYAAIRFFIRNPLLQYWGYLMVTLDHWLPQAGILHTVGLERFPSESFFADYAADQVSVFFGSPGALQKLSIYAPGKDGKKGKVAKVALQDTANHAVSQESIWLSRLHESQLMSEFLPTLLNHGQLRCGLRYFSMHAFPNGKTPARFANVHHAFLKILSQQHLAYSHWQTSQAHQRLLLRIDAVSLLLDQDIRILLAEVTKEIEDQIAYTKLPNCFIHGDFTPWNTRQANQKLFVFDWEYAQTCGNPLQDFLNFHLIPSALKRWSWQKISIGNLMTKLGTYADKQFEPSSGVSAARGALTLHYLMDTITFYVEASGYIDRKHPVIKTFIELLEQRKDWLPSTQGLTHASV